MSERLKRIQSRDDLLKLSDELGVRFDWHEPDEVGVTAQVGGKDFDNAGFWHNDEAARKGYEELYVRLYRKDDLVAVVNLATLFAFATGYEG